MKVSRQSRNYVEAVGHAVAFGICATVCDVFQQPTMNGYIHGVRDVSEAQLDLKQAFTDDAFQHWTRLMRKAEDLAHSRGHDPCQYGVYIYALINNVLIMALCRHSYSMETALDNAEAEMTESWLFDMSDLDKLIRLEDHGREPGTDGFYEQRANFEFDYDIPYDDEYNASRRAGELPAG